MNEKRVKPTFVEPDENVKMRIYLLAKSALILLADRDRDLYLAMIEALFPGLSSGIKVQSKELIQLRSYLEQEIDAIAERLDATTPLS